MKFDVILANTSQTGFNPIWLFLILSIIIGVAAAIASNARSKKSIRRAKIEVGSRFPPRSIESRLTNLEELRSKDVISQREYEAQRLNILDDI